jgi:hypothetical protein
VLTERTAAPSVVGYMRQGEGWRRIVIDDEIRLIEAGATFGDIDGDGHLDFIAGGEGRSNEIWWYENPGPALDAAKPWIRRTIKKERGKEAPRSAVGRRGWRRRPRAGVLESGRAATDAGAAART